MTLPITFFRDETGKLFLRVTYVDMVSSGFKRGRGEIKDFVTEVTEADKQQLLGELQ